jgi:predicted molibdopterin-dependent oxidoreductase YjgC
MTAGPVRLTIDGVAVQVGEGTSVAAAVLAAGVTRFRPSLSGTPRGPLCAMGTCFECLLTVDGRPRLRSCLIDCHDGMVVETGARNP